MLTHLLATTTTETAPSALGAIGGATVGLVAAVLQLVIALSIASFAIKKGLDLLSKLISGDTPIDIWEEIKKRNVAVALLGAGVVISYCNVIGSGIQAVSAVLAGLRDRSPAHTALGLVGAGINIAVAIAVASFAITIVFRVMDKFTTDIDEKAEFKNGNVAIGAVYCGIIIGVSFLVASGVSSIGMGVSNLLNAALSACGVA